MTKKVPTIPVSPEIPAAASGEAERAVVFRNYSERVGEMINGIVKRIDRGAIIIELGDTEGIIPRNHQVRHERYTQGDRIRAVVVDVTMDASRPQVVMSRTDPKLLEKLLEREEMVSTAIFPGIAIPHPRKPDECPVAEPRIVLGISSAGVDFDSLDGQPTYALFLIFANRVEVHLKVLAELTMLFRQSGLVGGLREARSGAEALDLLFRRTEGGAPGSRD